MKKFLLRTGLFLSPFFCLYAVTKLYYSTTHGDLRRIGYVMEDAEYRNKFSQEFKRPVKFKTIAQQTGEKRSGKSVLVIGDSFSKQGAFGYHNYLADADSINVTYIEAPKGYENPIEIVNSILNGDVLDKMPVDFIVLQSVERSFVLRAKKENLNLTKKLSFQDFLQKGEKKAAAAHSAGIPFPPTELLKFPLFNLLYYIDDNAFMSNVYKVSTSKPMFTGNYKNELLFYKSDLVNMEINNDEKGVVRLNDELNKLSAKLQQKGVKLIVLPSPDKFDMYYDFIQGKENYPKPMFFEYMKGQKKNYLYVDSKTLLRDAMQRKHDIYFYDDSHWSPWASQLIAGKLQKIISAENPEPAASSEISMNID